MSERNDAPEQISESMGDYLWDKSGPVDPHVEQLEEALRSLRREGASLKLPRRRLLGVHPIHAIAAGLLIVVSIAWLLMQPTNESIESWTVQAIAGEARIGDAVINAENQLAVGQWLETGSGGEVRVEVASIGNVKVKPNSRIRLIKSAGDEHRMQLAQGRIEAFISAPPRLFFVETPSATAIDMGCLYELEVDEHGDGWLAVEVGWVVLETASHASSVPRGAMCALRAGAGPGTPVFEDAADAFRAAIDRIDRGDASDSALDEVIATTRAKDSLTLWHLLPRVDETTRQRVAAHLVTLLDQPRGVSARELAQLDSSAMDRAWEETKRAIRQ